MFKKWRLCVFEAPEGRGRALEWASSCTVTTLSSHEDLRRILICRSVDLVVVCLRASNVTEIEKLFHLAARIVPVIAALDVIHVDTIVSLLDRGADDVVLDSISASELVARARAVARRGPQRLYRADAVTSGVVACAPSEVAHLLSALRRSELALFHYLLHNVGRLVPQRELIKNVFGGTHSPDTSLVRVHISQLRRQLGPYSRALRTFKGRGYLLDPAVFPRRPSNVATREQSGESEAATGLSRALTIV